MVDEQLTWDQARPGRDCLDIAIGRMLHAEFAKHQGVHTITCLADLTCFYDHVDLDEIIEPARELGYPPLHLKFALDLYRGPRAIQAEGINGDPRHYDRGILQGCPQAPAISKLILFKPLKAFLRDLGVDSTAGRKRRVAQVKRGFSRAVVESGSCTDRLRLSTGIRYRLHKEALHPVMSCGNPTFAHGLESLSHL